MVSSSSYQAFRTCALEQAQKHRESDRIGRYLDEDDHSPKQSRSWQIRLAREWVSSHARTLLVQDPATEPHIRRLLGIPATIPLIPEHWSMIRRFGQLFVPISLTWPYVRGVMEDVKTYQGREYLFEHFYKRFFPHKLDFSPTVDLALRRLETPSLQEALDLRMLDPGWVKATYALGLRKLSQIAPHAHYGHRGLDGALAYVLVQTKIITTVAELKWLKYREPHNYNRPERDARALKKVRRMVELMLSYGIARQPIAEAFKFSMTTFSLERLEANLNCIRAAGAQEISELFVATGDRLWNAKPANWSFVLNVVGAKSPQEVKRFKRLLDAYEPPSSAMAMALIALGATLDEMVQCQKLLLKVERDGKAAPVAELNLLSSQPHALNIEQIAQSVEYLTHSDELAEYLAVLSKYGFGNAAAVLAFQNGYRGMSSTTLENWLLVLGRRGTEDTVAIAEWVWQQSNKGERIGSYQYLVQAISMPDFKHLQQAEPVACFGRTFLEFLVVRKGLASVQQLRDWYYEARGVQDLRYWSVPDAVSLVFLDDAYERNNFAFVSSNEANIYSALQERVEKIIGPRTFRSDEATRAQYEQSYNATRLVERAALLPVLPSILAETGGLLLKSVLRHAWQPPQVMQAQISALTPLVNELLEGQGPSGAMPSDLEAEVIAMVYKTSADTVSRAWSRVKGCEHHHASLILSRHYPMHWERSIRRQHDVLERKSLLALAEAKSFAERFSPNTLMTTFDACKHLRAKRLADKAQDPWSLAAHLGVLFAAGRGDSVLDHWLTHDLDSVAHIVDEGPEVLMRLEQLDQILTTTLPDALKAHAESFARRFSDADARFLAVRLVGNKVDRQSVTGHELLLEAVYVTQDVALATCRRWMQREQRKFVKDRGGKNASVLSAAVSKHPAAYFAKHAADLCTRDNTAMWLEERHAHMVVFDPVQRRLAGMALLYIEPIRALCHSRNCLIIRAINPMDYMLASHSASSIVDAFFDVAIEIAKANNLAAVAFPSHNNAHLLSNQRPIEKDLEKRFMRRAELYRAPRRDEVIQADNTDWRTRPRSVSAEFYAYHHGEERVSKLFVVWANGSLPSTLKDEYAVS